MSDTTAERRGATRHPLVLAADVMEISSGTKLSARTADISSTGCYLDTLNPVSVGSQIRLTISHHDELFVAEGRVMYISPGLGMGVAFRGVSAEQQAVLMHWLEAKDQ
jgi:hypothetical protein